MEQLTKPHGGSRFGQQFQEKAGEVQRVGIWAFKALLHEHDVYKYKYRYKYR